MEDMSMEEEVMQDAAQAQTAPAEEPTDMSASEAQSSVPAANGANKLFNILGLVLAIGFVILDVLLLALFTLGAASAFDVELSVDGLTGYVQMLLAGLSSTNDVLEIVIIALFAVVWAADVIYILVQSILSLIGVFSLCNLDRPYEDERLKLSKASRKVLSCYSLASMLILLAGCTTIRGIGGNGVAVLTIAAVIYVVSFVFFTLFKAYERESRKFDWKVLLIDLAKNVVMVTIGVLLMVICLTPFLQELNISFRQCVMEWAGLPNKVVLLYETIYQPLVAFLFALAVLVLVGLIYRHYILNNSRKDINQFLRNRFIGLIVMVVLFFAIDCIVGMTGSGMEIGDLWTVFLQNYLGILLLSVGGLLCALAFCPKYGGEVVRN